MCLHSMLFLPAHEDGLSLGRGSSSRFFRAVHRAAQLRYLTLLFKLSTFPLREATSLMLLSRVTSTVYGIFTLDSGMLSKLPVWIFTKYCLFRRKPTPAEPPKRTIPLLQSTSMI